MLTRPPQGISAALQTADQSRAQPWSQKNIELNVEPSLELLCNQYLKMCLLDDDMTLTWMNYARPLIRDLRK